MRVVQERWNRITHTLVQVIDNRDGSFDAGGQAWITFCDDHGNYCEHETRALAVSHAADPTGWCEECRQSHKLWTALTANWRTSADSGAVNTEGHSAEQEGGNRKGAA